MSNPRYQNGALRRKYRARFRAMDAPCGICRGLLGPIHYDEPSDAQHPLSFVIDEIRPVSRWKMYGYPSAAAAAHGSSTARHSTRHSSLTRTFDVICSFTPSRSSV